MNTGNFSTGFYWNDVWYSMTDQIAGGDDRDDGPPTGVREPRRPRPPLAPAAAALPLNRELETV